MMSDTVITKEELEVLRNGMEHGDYTVLVDITEKSYKHVWNVMNGRAEDIKVVEAAIEMISKRNTKRTQVKKRISKLKPE